MPRKKKSVGSKTEPSQNRGEKKIAIYECEKGHMEFYPSDWEIHVEVPCGKCNFRINQLFKGHK